MKTLDERRGSGGRWTCSRCQNENWLQVQVWNVRPHFGRSVLRSREARTAPVGGFSRLNGLLFRRIPNPVFEYSGEPNRDYSARVDAPCPSKAHVQTARAGVTSGARDFENVEQFGNRYLNRADSENRPAKDSRPDITGTTQQACPSIRTVGDNRNASNGGRDVTTMNKPVL